MSNPSSGLDILPFLVGVILGFLLVNTFSNKGYVGDLQRRIGQLEVQLQQLEKR